MKKDDKKSEGDKKSNTPVDIPISNSSNNI